MWLEYLTSMIYEVLYKHLRRMMMFYVHIPPSGAYGESKVYHMTFVVCRVTCVILRV